MVVRDVLWLGYPQVLLKPDNEPAIVKVLREALGVLKVAGLQAGEEHPPPYDSQANGSVEAAVKQVKGRLRTVKLCLEHRLKKRIPPQHPVMHWLVLHVADLMRFRNRGSDSKTAYERVRFRLFNRRLLCSGEMCKYKNRSKEPARDEQTWHKGCFLGMCPLSGQYILYDGERESVHMARTIKLMSDEMKWSTDTMEKLNVTPYDEHKTRDQGVAFQDREEKPEDKDVPRRKQMARRLYTKAKDFRAYGYTVGCPKCDHERRYGPGRTTKSHSNACRDRIMSELVKTPEGRRRIAAAEIVRTSLWESIWRNKWFPPSIRGKLRIWPLESHFVLNISSQLLPSTTEEPWKLPMITVTTLIENGPQKLMSEYLTPQRATTDWYLHPAIATMLRWELWKPSCRWRR